ncbi:hypothetical protein IKW75_03670 [Candidatus Saccharibacteria bacterium]|nr:hypothetical protein [Candidatus Saccharibacteria bacterium]
MVNIDIMELYKMYAANPDTFQLVFKNFIFHELLVIKDGIDHEIAEINDAESYDRSTAKISMELDRLPELFKLGISTTEFLRCVPFNGKYTGEDARVRLGIAKAKVERVKDKFFEKLNEGITPHTPKDEANNIREQNFEPAKAHAVALLRDVNSYIETTEANYSKN